MTNYDRAKRFYSRATYVLSDFLHGRIDEQEFRKQWQRLADKAVNEEKLRKPKCRQAIRKGFEKHRAPTL